MKFSPSVTLALILSAGMAGTALAQTSATQGAAGAQPQWNARHPSSSYAQTSPQGSAAATNPAATNPAGQMQPTTQSEAGATPQVREAQQQLKAAGLYNGPVDGVMDPDTRMAIARFQDQHGLRRSETLDPQTQAALTSAGTAGYGASTPGATGSGMGAARSTTSPSSGAAGASTNRAAPRY
ncbi:MAG TPA: peptidoglycan-binding domain-containing protein [Stellaceae bacterium]|nr:peptidoglycan-binding domain-containing protein [Stellaceae bacterium]